MPGLPEKLITEFEGLQQAHPYVPYGAYVKRQAEELVARSKRGQRRPEQRPEEWDILQVLSDDEKRLILSNPTFAREVLQRYDPAFRTRAPSPQQVRQFRDLVDRNEGGADLFPQVAEGQQFPQFNPQEQARIRAVHQARVAENTRLGQQAETMLGQTSRLAPLSPLHTTAKTMLQANNPGESLRLGREEIAAAGRTNVPREIAPYMASASETPEAFLRQYEMNYDPIIENLRRDFARDFLEHDFPTIENHYASKGAFFSGAREAALDKARAEKARRFESEVAKLRVHAREQGMKHYDENRQAKLKQAEIAGHAHQADQEGHLRAAEALRVNSGMEQAGVHGQVSALGQLARTEQQQAQNELNVRQQEHREEMERPFIRQIQKAALPRGIAQPEPRLSPESINPPPPSVYGLGAGMLGQMAGLAGQQQGHHAKGGHVRKGYAAGDSVARAASQLQQMKGHIQDSPEEAEMRQSAQGFKNHRANPMADYLFALGSHQLANLSGSPMKAFGEGSQLGMQAYKAAQGANLSAQEKYHNLMGKINQTKMNQQQFLANYHSKIQEQEEASRYHNAYHGENIRHHRAMEEEKKRGHDLARMASIEANSQGNPNIPQFSSKEEEKSFWKEQQEAKKEFRLHRQAIDKDINNFRHLKGLINKGIGKTGPASGFLPNAVATWLDAPEVASNRFLAQKALNEKVLDMSGAMKGAQSDKDMAIVQGTVPSMYDTPLTFKRYLDKWEKLAIRAEDEKKFIDGKMKEGIPITLAQEEWHEYVNSNPLFSEEEGENGNEAGNVVDEESRGNSISMHDPEGNPLKVPEDQVEEALRMGAFIAQ